MHFKRFAKTPRTRITAGWSEPVSERKFHPLKSSADSRRTVSPIHVVLSQALISTTESGEQDEKDQNETDSCRYSDDPLLPA